MTDLSSIMDKYKGSTGNTPAKPDISAIMDKYKPQGVQSMKQPEVGMGKSLMYGAGELALGGLTAARDFAVAHPTGSPFIPSSATPGLSKKIESATEPYYKQAIEGSKAAHQQVEGSGMLPQLAEGAGFYGPQMALPASGVTRLGTAALGGLSNAVSNVMDPTQSKDQRYGVGSNLAAGATGAIATPLITGALGKTLTKGLETARAVGAGDMGKAAKKALGTVVAPVTGAMSEAAKTAQDLAMKIPGADKVVSSIHRIFDPTASAAKDVQGRVSNLKQSIENIDKNVALSQKTGVPVSTGQAAQDPGLAVLERESRSKTSSAAALFPQEQHKIAAQVIENITKDAPESMEQLGKSLGERRSAILKEQGTKVDEAYKKLEGVLPASTPHTANLIPKLFMRDRGLSITPGTWAAKNISAEGDKYLTKEAADLRKHVSPGDFDKFEKQVMADVSHATTVGDMKTLSGKYYDLAEGAKHPTGKDSQMSAAYKIISSQFRKEYEEAYAHVSPKLLEQAKQAAKTDFKYRNILHDYLGAEKRDINDAAKSAGNFLASLKNARGTDTQAFNLMWNKAPTDMKADVFNYVFAQSLDPRTGELSGAALKKTLKTLSPEVKRKFEQFRPGQMQRLSGIAEQLDHEKFVQTVGKMPGSDTAYKLQEAAQKAGGHVMRRIFGGATGLAESAGQWAWALASNQKMKSAILEQAILDPNYAKALLSYDLSKPMQDALKKGNFNALREAIK